jgi:hypothetical protein
LLVLLLNHVHVLFSVYLKGIKCILKLRIHFIVLRIIVLLVVLKLRIFILINNFVIILNHEISKLIVYLLVITLQDVCYHITATKLAFYVVKVQVFLLAFLFV